MIERSRALCATAGLRLHKFISNERDVLEKITESERAKSLKEVDLRVDPLPLERALGIIWCIEMDVFNFRIELRDGPLTRRGMLSTISSIFDPVGFLAPVLLEGKRILQDLCRENASWYDPVPDHLNIRWRNWRQDLSNLDNFEVQRCSKPDTFGVTEKIELHHFSDASATGYGECSYIRMINQLGKIHCSFVMGKARVAPLNHVSVPRLELTAALVSAKISAFLERELKYEYITHYYWVDSKVVIAYIQNEAKRFHVYVANRVQQIRDLTSPDAWLYVESQLNPSDLASRGSSVAKLVHSRWLHGPLFLWERLNIEKATAYCCDEKTEALVQGEMRKATVFKVCTSFSSSENKPSLKKLEISPLLDHISCWYRAKRCVANCLLFKAKLLSKLETTKVVEEI